MKKELELEMMKANLLNTHELLNLLHNQRHSYVGHIQAISAMAFLEEYDSLGEYVKGISKEYRLTSEILRVGNPALTALINTKKEIAQERGIAFEVECKHKIDRITIESWDLSNLLSNLLENAIEAAVESNEKPPSIKMTIAYSDQVYKFDIENTGQIKYDIVNTILEPGITSKGSIGRGYGLYICKKILDKYNGILTFNNTQNSTVVFTICLPGEDSVYDKKVS
jgi:sensor histidine kinase regulating citrate/malate metabolism